MKKILLTLCFIIATSISLTSCSFVTNMIDSTTSNLVEKEIRNTTDVIMEDKEDNQTDEVVAEEKISYAELLKSYEGSYSNGISWHYGGEFLFIECGKDELILDYHELRSAPYSQDAQIYLSFDYDEIDNDVLEADFEDSWGNTGHITIAFNDGITISIADVESASDLWGVSPGTKYLSKDEYVNAKVDYGYEDYAIWERNGFPEFTFDENTLSFFYSLPEKPKNLLEDMSNEQKRALNLFLSNFSEVCLMSYGHGDNDEDELLYFGFKHNEYNSTGRVSVTNSGYYAISEADMDLTLQRYFGVNAPRHSNNEVIYSENTYYFPLAAGQALSYFSVARNMTDNLDGTYTVEFEFFSDENGTPINSASYSLDIEGARTNYQLTGEGTAIVTKKNYNGTETYELKQYDNLYY